MAQEGFTDVERRSIWEPGPFMRHEDSFSSDYGSKNFNFLSYNCLIPGEEIHQSLMNDVEILINFSVLKVCIEGNSCHQYKKNE